MSVIPSPTLSMVFQVIIESDLWYATFILLLGLSNGYVTSIALMHGPKVMLSL